MIQLELSYKTTTIGLNTYLQASDDWMLTLVKNHETTKRLHSVVREAKSFMCNLSIKYTNQEVPMQNAAKTAKSMKSTAKRRGIARLRERWEQKPLHGQYPLRTQDADVDNVQPISGYEAWD